MKIRWVLIFLFLFWLLGYIREYFFVNLNGLMYEKYYGYNTVPTPTPMRFFARFSYNTLYYSKYAYTFLCILLFFLLSYVTVRKLAETKILRRYLVYSYAILLLLACISMIYGYFINDRLQDDEYTVSRWLLGVAQSPIVCFILIASEKLYNKSFRS